MVTNILLCFNIIIAMAARFPNSEKVEEKGYTTFHVEGGEIHLKRYNVRRTWGGALEMCRSDGATLVKIDTAEKQDIIRGLFHYKDYKNNIEGGEIHLKRSDVRHTWGGALEMCRSDGATLVKIDTAEKQDIVRSLFHYTDYKNNIKPWIGLRDTDRSNVYRWTDGYSTTYTNWDKGEPSFHLESRTRTVSTSLSSTWNDNDCGTNRDSPQSGYLGCG